MPVITTIEDLRLLAKQRVPKMFYDYADSGSWTEQTYRAALAWIGLTHHRSQVAKRTSVVMAMIRWKEQRRRMSSRETKGRR